MILRTARAAALWGITVLVAVSTLVAFGESYRALYLWARRHGLAGAWAYAWPLQVDTFLAVGELALVVALADKWPPRSRAAAWAVTGIGLAVSVAGNVGHVAGHSATSRATAAIPPLAAAAALAVGLGVLKRAAGATAGDSGATLAVPVRDSEVDRMIACHASGMAVVYRFFDAGGKLLYIGMTCHPLGRFDLHSRNKAWWPEVRNVTLEWHDSLDSAADAERVAIGREWPRYNHHFNDHISPDPAGAADLILGDSHAESEIEPERGLEIEPRPRQGGAKAKSGRARAMDALTRDPTLSSQEVAQKTRVSLRTAQRAKEELERVTATAPGTAKDDVPAMTVERVRRELNGAAK